MFHIVHAKHGIYRKHFLSKITKKMMPSFTWHKRPEWMGFKTKEEAAAYIVKRNMERCHVEDGKDLKV